MNRKEQIRYAFAGNREIAVSILQFLVGEGALPHALLLPDKSDDALHELRTLCPHLPPERVLKGSQFREPDGVALLKSLSLDYLICIHFPFIIPSSVLEIPRIGAINLHPAYLPYNRGWHTPSWAILEGTPFGATLHFMSEGLDEGDVIHQRRIDVGPCETADSLYEAALATETMVFKEAWPSIKDRQPPATPQPDGVGTAHKKADLLSPDIQEIHLDEPATARELIRHLRALTTNRIEEAAYFRVEGGRCRIQIMCNWIPDEIHQE